MRSDDKVPDVVVVVVDCQPENWRHQTRRRFEKIHGYILSGRNLGVLLLLGGTAADFELIFSHSPSHRSAADGDGRPPNCLGGRFRKESVDSGSSACTLGRRTLARCSLPWPTRPNYSMRMLQQQRQHIDTHAVVPLVLTSILPPPPPPVLVFWALGHLDLSESPDTCADIVVPNPSCFLARTLMFDLGGLCSKL